MVTQFVTPPFPAQLHQQKIQSSSRSARTRRRRRCRSFYVQITFDGTAFHRDFPAFWTAIWCGAEVVATGGADVSSPAPGQSAQPARTVSQRQHQGEQRDSPI